MDKNVEAFAKLRRTLDKAVAYYEVGDTDRSACALALLYSFTDQLGRTILSNGHLFTTEEIAACMDEITLELAE